MCPVTFIELTHTDGLRTQCDAYYSCAKDYACCDGGCCDKGYHCCTDKYGGCKCLSVDTLLVLLTAYLQAVLKGTSARRARISVLRVTNDLHFRGLNAETQHDLTICFSVPT